MPQRGGADQAIVLVQVSDLSRFPSARQIGRGGTGSRLSGSNPRRNKIGGREIARADPEVTTLSDQVNHAVRHIQVNGHLAVLLGKLASNRSDEALAQRNAAGDPQISPRL